MKAVTVTIVILVVLATLLSAGMVGASTPMCPTPTPPTNVFLVRFEAAQQGRAVLLEWETANEIDNLGFNLYRSTSPTGLMAKLNKTLIPGQGMGSPIGYVYAWTDYGPPGFYWLEDVDVYGHATMHGPIGVMAEIGDR